MPIYTYQKKPMSLAQITSSTGLVPVTYDLAAPPQESFEFALPLTADEEAALDQFEDDLGYEPVAGTSAITPSLYSFSGSFEGAVGLVTAYFANPGKNSLASLTPVRHPVISSSKMAKIGLNIESNALTTGTTFRPSISGGPSSGAPAPEIIVPALFFGYLTASGDISFNDGDQVDLVATNTAGGILNIIVASATVQLF